MKASRNVPEPTEAQLQMAYRELRTPVWPDTLQATLAHPVYGTCLRQAARHRHRASPCAAPQPTTPARQARPYALPTYDARRAAANDRDDD